MTGEQLIAEISKVQVLRHLTYPVLRRLVLAGRLIEAQAGKTIIAPGQGSRSFFLVISGSVRVELPTGTVLANLGPQQFFGEIALLEGIERTAICRAASNSVLFEVPPQSFQSDLATNPLVKSGMLAIAKLRRAMQLKANPSTAPP